MLGCGVRSVCPPSSAPSSDSAGDVPWLWVPGSSQAPARQEGERDRDFPPAGVQGLWCLLGFGAVAFASSDSYMHMNSCLQCRTRVFKNFRHKDIQILLTIYGHAHNKIAIYAKHTVYAMKGCMHATKSSSLSVPVP